MNVDRYRPSTERGDTLVYANERCRFADEFWPDLRGPRLTARASKLVSVAGAER